MNTMALLPSGMFLGVVAVVVVATPTPMAVGR